MGIGVRGVVAKREKKNPYETRAEKGKQCSEEVARSERGPAIWKNELGTLRKKRKNKKGDA